MKELWFYLYAVKYWDDIEEKEDEDCGFVRAETSYDAVRQVALWYGEDNINDVRVKAIEDGDGPLNFDKIKKNLKEFAYGKD